MARAFAAFCCFIVGLQLLIGVPVVVCIAFFALCGGLGPIAIEIHPGATHSPHMFVNSATIAPPPAPLTIAPPPNIIPPAPALTPDNPILETRDLQGSPLAGTLLSQGTPPEVERNEFVAALQKVASEAIHEPVVESCTALAGNCGETTTTGEQTDAIILQHLYRIADIDEQAGNYERADQWRALAREIRHPPKESPNDSSQAASAPTEPSALDLP
jgi:hypothetical protein